MSESPDRESPPDANPNPSVTDTGSAAVPADADSAGSVPETDLAGAVEALIFASEAPLTLDAIRDALSDDEGEPESEAAVRHALERVRARHDAAGSGIQLMELGGAWELRTRPEFARQVRSLYRRPAVKLSRPALEVLAVVAYRQPCTRADIEEIRGVDCSGLLRTLLERELLRIIGKADDVGRPLLYGTSQTFLEFFGLSSLAELPTLKEYTELTEAHLTRVQELDETLRANEAVAPTSQMEPPE